MSTNGALTLERIVPGVGTIVFEQDDKRRVYWFTPEGGKRRQRMPSVTTILRATWPKPALLEWYAKHGRDTETLLERAAERGKAVHAFVERFMATGDLMAFSDFPAGHHGYLQAAARFLWDFFPQAIATERLVVHPELKYAGRLDLIAMVDGEPTLLDFKSNTHGRVYTEAHVQATAYAIADERCGGEPITRTMLVGLAEAGDYHPVAGHDGTKLWGAALTFYDELRRFEKVAEATSQQGAPA
jgi:PD-(D/E)XK nuclease superfamily protein